MAWLYQWDEDPPLLAHRNGRKKQDDDDDDDEDIGMYGYCEARSNFFNRFQMVWKVNYELHHTLILKHHHTSMVLSKGMDIY